MLVPKALRLAAFAAVLLLTMLIPAVAAPPPPSGDIWLGGSAEARAAAGVTYGDTVTFGWTLDAGNKDYYVTIRVACFQGSRQVYYWAGGPDTAFPLHDQTQDGSWWDGGAAACTASLMASQNRHVLLVDQTSFDVAGTTG